MDSALLAKLIELKGSAQLLAEALPKVKNEALSLMAKFLDAHRTYVLAENKKDVERARAKGMKESLVDRLALNDRRIDEMIEMCNLVASLRDPVGEVVESFVREDGLKIEKIRVPIGVIAVIYESRPNVTVDATVLAIKSGNAVLLRGGSDAFHSNAALVKVIKDALSRSELPHGCVQFVEDTDRANIDFILKQRNYIDLIVPRGGRPLIEYVVNNSTVPVLETGAGVCHIFVDESADLERSVDVIDNAKTQRPGTCNAVETVLVHRSIAERFLPLLKARFDEKRVEIRGCEVTQRIIPCTPASEDDWATEYLDLVVSVKVVDGVDEAIEHIRRYSTKHSDAILTENYTNAMKFLSSVDSAAVYVNASTRFTDGGQFGMGAEMGISTQRLHARGPVGLRELTTTKFVVFGNYHTRP